MRALKGDERVVLERLVEVLRGEPDVSESDLVPRMQALCEGTDLTLKAFR